MLSQCVWVSIEGDQRTESIGAAEWGSVHKRRHKKAVFKSDLMEPKHELKKIYKRILQYFLVRVPMKQWKATQKLRMLGATP